MLWWRNEKEMLEKTEKGREVLEKYEEIFSELEEFLKFTSKEEFVNLSDEKLNNKMNRIKEKVEQVPKESINIDEEGENSVNLYNMFSRMIDVISGRIDRRFERRILILLKEKREEKNMSITKLSKLSNVSASFISRYESGQRNNISLSKLKAICNVLEIDVEEVFDKVNKPEKYTFEELLLNSNFVHKDNQGYFYSTKEKIKVIELVRKLSDLQLTEDNFFEKMSDILNVIREYEGLGEIKLSSKK